MATIARIPTPRFLLPQYGFIRHQYLSTNFARRGLSGVRYASTKAKSKQTVLEKPAKFNPPSHGARLPRKSAVPRHYGGDLGAAEAAAQKARDYPGMMAPEGSWGHWIWNSRRFHLLITLGTLTSLAIYTLVLNIRHNSPFMEMMPSGSDFTSHPIDSIRTIVEVLRLTEAHRSSEVAELRKSKVDDVAKRNMYRKAHGMETKGLGGLTHIPDTEPEPARPVKDPANSKKWLGIF